MARSRSVFLYCMAAALHNPALSSLVPRCRLALCRSLLRAGNPNLPSVSPFRRMIDDAGGPNEGSTLVVSFLRGRRVPAGTTNESRHDLFTTMRFCDETETNRYARLFTFKVLNVWGHVGSWILADISLINLHIKYVASYIPNKKPINTK